MIGVKIKNLIKLLHQKKKGLTLIELLVSISIFSIVVVVSLGLFNNIIKDQRKGLAVQNAQENARYLLNFMAKEIRMAQILTADGSSLVLAIDHPINGSVTYSFSGGELTREDGDGVATINSNDVQVDGQFIIVGTTLGDNIQPKVTLVLQATATGSKVEEQSTVNLQTTISSRPLD